MHDVRDQDQTREGYPPESPVPGEDFAGEPSTDAPAKADLEEANASKPDVDPEPVEDESELDNWPSKGYDGPQPWETIDPYDPEVRALHDDPGSENTVTAVVIDHAHPILSSGSAGLEVVELCRHLKRLGYETTVSRGQNVASVLDASVLQAVQSFRRDYGVREDPAQFGSANDVENYVGPYTWEALARAVDQAE